MSSELHECASNISWIFSIKQLKHIIQMCSGITRGRVLNGELHAQRLLKLIYSHLFTDCFMKISRQSSEHEVFVQNLNLLLLLARGP